MGCGWGIVEVGFRDGVVISHGDQIPSPLVSNAMVGLARAVYRGILVAAVCIVGSAVYA